MLVHMKVEIAIGLFFRLLRFVSLALVASTISLVAESPKPFRVDDMLRMEQIGNPSGGNAVVSSDGKSFAFTKSTPKTKIRNYLVSGPVSKVGGNGIGGATGAEVWVQLSSEEKPRQAVPAPDDESVWELMQWSPNGTMLALLRNGVDSSTLWIWDKRIAQVRRVSDLPVDWYKWMDDSHIAFLRTPVGLRGIYQRGIGVPDGIRILPKAWKDAQEGERTTASVLSGGVTSAHGPNSSENELEILDIGTGQIQRITRCGLEDWSVSPFGQTIGVLRRPGSQSNVVGTIELWDLKGNQVYPKSGKTASVFPPLVRWSPDGREIAFIGPRSGPSGEPKPTLYRVRTADGVEQAVPIDPLILSENGSEAGLEWTGNGELILLADEKSGQPPTAPRRDWWLIRTASKPIALTKAMPEVPTDLVRLVDGKTFVGVAAGFVWRIFISGAAPAELIGPESMRNASRLKIEWPKKEKYFLMDQWVVTAKDRRSILLSAESDGQLNYLEVDLQSGLISELARPHPKAWLAAYSDLTGDSFFGHVGPTGSFLWRQVKATHTTQTLLSANEWLKDVSSAEFREFEYRGGEGQLLKAIVLIPPGFQRGKRYPLAAWVYPREHGAYYRLFAENNWSIASRDPYNLQLLAAQGYIVVVPSMPLQQMRTHVNHMTDVKDNLMPAINKLVDEGMADENRLFVLGQSEGGYTTNVLVTITGRFKAAVSLAGPVDYAGSVSILDPRSKYAEDQAAGAISMTARIDLAQNIRNSVVLNVDRVATPILLLHGDFDTVPIEGAESFFLSLAQRNKRVDFVRYWGESHVLQSPANIRDCWSRIFAWFDEFGDIQRDAKGELVWDGDHVKSRNGAPALKSEDFLKLEHFFDPNFGRP